MNKLTLNEPANVVNCAAKFITSWNLNDLNENYTTNFYICEKLHHIINDFRLSNEQLTVLALFTYMEITCVHEKLE